MNRCWMDYQDWIILQTGKIWYEQKEEINPYQTCMLEEGHAGPHEWTPDENITVAFKPDPA